MVISRLGHILKKTSVSYDALIEETGIDIFSLEDIYNGNVPINKEDWGFAWDDLSEILAFLKVSVDELFEVPKADPTVTSIVFKDNYKAFEISARVDLKETGESFGIVLTGKIQFTMASMGAFEAEAILSNAKNSVNTEILIKTLERIDSLDRKAFMDEIEYVLTDHIMEYSQLDLADVKVSWTGELKNALKDARGSEELDKEFYAFFKRFISSTEGLSEWVSTDDNESDDSGEETFNVYDAFYRSLFPEYDEGDGSKDDD